MFLYFKALYYTSVTRMFADKLFGLHAL